MTDDDRRTEADKARAADKQSLEALGHQIVELAGHLNAACKEAEELGREAQQQVDRKLTWFHDQDGMLVIKARLPAEAGQMFIKAIEAACEEIPEAETPADVSAETPNVK